MWMLVILVVEGAIWWRDSCSSILTCCGLRSPIECSIRNSVFAVIASVAGVANAVIWSSSSSPSSSSSWPSWSSWSSWSSLAPRHHVHRLRRKRHYYCHRNSSCCRRLRRWRLRRSRHHSHRCLCGCYRVLQSLLVSSVVPRP